MSSKIPGYQVIRKVGDGGMSSVYLAIQLSVGREVALKVLSPELRTDPAFAERFYREANIVGALSNPHVISIYDVGKHGNHYYMAMDYLPGFSCKQLIRQQQVNVIKALQIVREIAKALEYIHAQGYLHCDIKPDNVLFRANGAAVLTDFGIAREIREEKNISSVAGTPHYMSPEQAQGHKLDKSSDIYSLGVLLYEMLSGRLPFLGKDPIAIAIKHVSAPIPDLPDEIGILTPLIRKMLAKKPGQRFLNANELIQAIDFFEAQYLKQENTDLPLRLKVDFYLEKWKDSVKSWIGIRKKLVYSLRHGLILKLTDDDFELCDVESLAKKIGQTIDTRGATTLNMAGLTGDSIALALETDQAKKIISSPLLHLLLLGVVAGVTYPFANEILMAIFGHTGKPVITYID
jgi:serine/threonine protein kinase